MLSRLYLQKLRSNLKKMVWKESFKIISSEMPSLIYRNNPCIKLFSKFWGLVSVSNAVAREAGTRCAVVNSLNMDGFLHLCGNILTIPYCFLNKHCSMSWNFHTLTKEGAVWSSNKEEILFSAATFSFVIINKIK